MEGKTYECDVSNLAWSSVGAVLNVGVDIVDCPLVMDQDIHVIGLRERRNRELISVSCWLGHASEVLFPGHVNLIFGRSLGGTLWCAFATWSVSPAATDFDEWLEVIWILSHIVDDFCTDVLVLVLVSVQLVGHGAEETVAWKKSDFVFENISGCDIAV